MDAPSKVSANWGIVATVFLVFSGCVIVPTPHYGLGQISVDTINSVRIGDTTCEDVLLRLGEPVYSVAEDRGFCYEWSVTIAYGGMLLLGPGALVPRPIGGEAKKHHDFCIAFGKDGVVRDTASFKEKVFSNRSEFESERDRWINRHVDNPE